MFRGLFNRIRQRPAQYAAIPMVAAGVGWGTNWMGVKMLFYPIEYIGVEVYREENCPYGFFGWQGVVPARTERMAKRLTDIVSTKLLSLKEAFSHVEPMPFARLLSPTIEESIRQNAPNGHIWAWLMSPFLPLALRMVVVELQENIDDVLDLETVVLTAFLRDKLVLVDLFQNVAKSELEFLVISGSYFGFVLGLAQMITWAAVPKPWTLPVAGAFVGYATNWIAIKLLFDPAEPTPVGPFIMQGLFEKRQPEVSEEFSLFLSSRVLTSKRLIDEMANGKKRDEFERLLRRTVPFVIPDSVVDAAAEGLRQLALEDADHPAHVYLDHKLAIEGTLCTRLQALSPTDFEDLLHPVFQQDEIILIVVGGILGAAAGFVQLRFGWGGPTTAKRVQEAVVRAGKSGRSKAAPAVRQH